MSVAKQNVLRTLVRLLGKDFSLSRKVFLTLCRATVRWVTALFSVFSAFSSCVPIGTWRKQMQMIYLNTRCHKRKELGDRKLFPPPFTAFQLGFQYSGA